MLHAVLKPFALVLATLAAAGAFTSAAAPRAPAAASATYTLSAKVLAVKRGTTTALTLRLYTATLGISANGPTVGSLDGVRRIRVVATRQTQIMRPAKPAMLTMRALRTGQTLAIRATAPAGATGRSLFRASLIVILSR